MTTHTKLSLKSMGLSVSAVLAVIYTLLMLASLLLVEKGTTGSWLAAFLGIGWSSVVGIEIGFPGILMVGFVVAAVVVPVYNFIHHLVARQSQGVERLSSSDQPFNRTWGFRLLSTLLVLLPLTLFSVHLLATVINSAAKTDVVAAANAPGFSGQAKSVNIGHMINTAYREAEPSFTADGQTMYFNCYNGDICTSHLSGAWEQGNLSTPERIGAPISTAYEEVEPVINATGDKLYITSRRPSGHLWRIPFLSPFLDTFRVINTIATMRSGRTILGGLGLSHVYVSYLTDGTWSEPRNLNEVTGEPPINSEFADHCLFISADGQEAFWTSTRPGGYGGNDIWTSRRINGNWTRPENLGPNVNSPQDDHHSILSPDGRTLYVTSMRPGGYGHDDIYFTARNADGNWEPLVNLGPLINGPGDDRCPVWTPDLKILLFDSVKQHGLGSRDIWWVYSKDVMGYPPAAAAVLRSH